MNINFSEFLKNENLTTSEFLELVAKRMVLQRLISKSIADAVNEWILEKSIEGKSNKTLRFYRDYIKGFVDYIGKDILVENIQPVQIKGYFQSCMIEGSTAHSQHARYRTISVFFNWCKRQSYCLESPVKVLPPKVPTNVIKVLDDKDMLLILKACNSSSTPRRDKAVFFLLWDTGMRLGELANIKLQDIDWQGRHIEIMGKGQKKRIVGISHRTAKALWDYIKSRNGKQDKLWLTEEGKPLTISGVQQIIKRTGKIALNRTIGPHLFRHTFATMYLDNGGDSLDLQYILGHSSLRMVQNYTKAHRIRRALKSMENLSPVDRLGK